MNIVKKTRFSSTLPATPCSKDMREAMEKIAVTEGASLAEVQRSAFEFFLAIADKKFINDDNKFTAKEETA